MRGAGVLKSLTKSTTSNIGLGQHAIGLGMSVGMEAITSGGSFSQALAKGVFWYGADAVAPGAFWLGPMSSAVGSATQAYIEEKRYGTSKIQKYYRGNFGGEFRDSQNGYTMRQRGVQAMQQSKINARSVLGSEARSFHTSF